MNLYVFFLITGPLWFCFIVNVVYSIINYMDERKM